MFVSSFRTVLYFWLLLGVVSLPAKDTNYDPDKNTSDTLLVASAHERLPISIQGDQFVFTLCQLERGKDYHLFLNRVDPSACAVQLDLLRRTDEAYLDDVHALQFRARESCENIQVNRQGCEANEAYLLSIGCESCDNPKAAPRSQASIQTNPSYTPESLIEDVLIGGDCFNVVDGSIDYTGETTARGYFSSGTSSINIEEGVMLSTGRLDNALGPNNDYNGGNQFSGWSQDDPDLEAIVDNSSTRLYDIASLEFDFTPTSDTLSFEFVFASEEYCEYTNNSYNDVFGFFISGPGINGPFSNNAENIAIVPGSSDYVTINNVNHLSNSDYYVENVPAIHHLTMPPWLFCTGHPLTDGAAVDDIEYDGFTTVLTALASVQPCETYHIKLIIADVNDGYFDSAVFLKANSFNAGGTATVSAETPGTNTATAFEGCADGYFAFERTNDDWSEDLVVNFSVSNLSSATPGLDYDLLPESITIPAGQPSFLLPVDVFEDAIAEGIESILIELDAPCSCTVPFTEMFISDAESLDLVLDDQSSCEQDNATLTPIVNGGIADYTYLWSTGDTSPTLEVSPTNTTDYSVTVTDFCGNTASSEATVSVTGYPTAMISGQESICPGGSAAELQIDFTGLGPWDLIYTIDNNQQISLMGITENPYTLLADQIGVYELLFINSNDCDGIVDGQANVTTTQISVEAATIPVSCPGESDGGLALTVFGGEMPYTYAWTNSLPNTGNPLNLAPGDYGLTLTDVNGCTHDTLLNVPLDNNIPQVNAGGDDLLSCLSESTLLNGSGSSGAAYNYQWTTVDGNIVAGANTLNPEVNEAGTYTLEITNIATGCTQSDDLTVLIDTVAPLALIDVLGPQTLDCNQSTTVLSGTPSQPANGLIFEWDSQDGLVLPEDINLPSIEINIPGTYSLTVTDNRNGCTDSNASQIDQNTDVPYVNIAQPGDLNCIDSIVQISALGSDFGPNYLIEWTTPNGNILSGANGLEPTVNEQGNYTLNIINLSSGCPNAASVEVIEDIEAPTVVIEAIEEMLDCNTSTIQLNASASSSGPDYSYWWTTQDGNIVADTLTGTPIVDAEGTYTLTVSSALNGCTASDEVQVLENRNRPVDADLQVIPPPCEGGAGSLAINSVTGGEGPYLYALNGDDVFYSDSLFVAMPFGWYTVTVQDINGCEYVEEVYLPNPPRLLVDVQTEVFMTLGDNHLINAQVNINPNELDSIIWSPTDSLACPTCLRTQANPTKDMIYTVTVVDKNGCTASDQILFKIDKERKVFIPNAFSPNSDGFNDVFMVYADDNSVRNIKRFEVFTRWGEKVYEERNFQPNDQNFGWNGWRQNEPFNPGVFVYYVEIEFIDGEAVLYKGDVTLTN